MTAVAVLGLGAMGSRVADRLVLGGHDVKVWNRTSGAAARFAAAGVEVAPSARAAVSDVEVAIAMVANDEASRSLWLDPESGALAALPPAAIAIEASTITRSMAIELGAESAAARRAFLEAPVVGSRPQAESGSLFVIAAGDETVVERARPVLDEYAGVVRHVGAVGNAAVMKLAINGLFGMQVAAYAEMLGLLERSAVPSELAMEILDALPITSPGLQRILGLVATRDFSPNFPIRLVAKDFRYLAELADDLDADTPVATASAAVFEKSASGAHGELDIAGIAARYLAT